jgi:hypothetical protein
LSSWVEEHRPSPALTVEDINIEALRRGEVDIANRLG